MQSREAPALLGLIALAAACVGCFVLLSTSDDTAFALLQHESSPARMSALAQVQVAKGGGSQAVRNLLKGNLESSEKDEEGKMYEHALKRAGLKLDPAAKKVIQLSLAKAGKKVSSLGIDPSLQQQVVVADSIKKGKAAHVKHVRHKQQHMSERLRLAEAILAGKKLTPATAHPKKAAPSAKKTVRQSMKTELSSEDHEALANMERRALKPQRSQAQRYLNSPEATSMMHELTGSERKRIATHSAHALTQQDLETKEWAHSDDTEDGGRATARRKQALPHKLDLTIGSGRDGTQLKVFDGPQNSRVALEQQLRSELDGKASNLGEEALMKEQLASVRPMVHDHFGKTAHKLVGEGRMQMEAQIRAGLEEKNNDMEEKMFHQALAKKQGFAHAKPSDSLWS